jgi:transcriptional regulator with XRE-family HTH domain
MTARKSGFKSDALSKAFGRNLRAIRNKKGLSLEDAEDLTGLQAAHLARLERGESAPNLRTISKLIKSFHISANDLFRGV